MKQGELDDAKREALNALDEWNDVSCVAPRGTGYYYELQGVIEDAVETGAKHNQGKCPSKAEVAREFFDVFLDSILDQDSDFYDRVAILLNDKVQEWETVERNKALAALSADRQQMEANEVNDAETNK